MDPSARACIIGNDTAFSLSLSPVGLRRSWLPMSNTAFSLFDSYHALSYRHARLQLRGTYLGMNNTENIKG